MAVSRIRHSFSGADGKNVVSITDATPNVTPQNDGWLAVHFATQSGQTQPPVARITQAGKAVAFGVGLTVSGTTASVCCPVKAGLRYDIEVYRATITGKTLFY